MATLRTCRSPIIVVLASAWVVACLTVVQPAVAASPNPAVTSAEAVRIARNEASEWSRFLPEELDYFSVRSDRKSAGRHVYWVVTFSDEFGEQQDRYVVDADTGKLTNSKRVLQELDAWDAYLQREGFVGDWTWASLGLASAVIAGVAGYFWSRRLRAGWVAWLVNGAQGLMVMFFIVGIFVSWAIYDTRGTLVAFACTAAIVVGPVLGRRERERSVGAATGIAPVTSASGSMPSAITAGGSAPVPAPAAGPVGGRTPGGAELHVTGPERLPCFADVGGMEGVKQQLRESVGLLISHGDLAKRYRIDWNGILLYGPPGVGKTFLAKAAAGEFGLNFIDIRVADLVSSFAGESSKLIAQVFKQSAAHRPCILFFDEFDSVGQRREDRSWDTESIRIVNQLLRELESAREIPDLIVMAATNHKKTLDDAVIRPGRFDRHIAIGLPDAEARRKVFHVQLKDRPVLADLDLEELIHLTDGMTAADISAIVNTAALEALRESVSEGRIASGSEEAIGQDLLMRALEALRTKVSSVVTPTRWDDLVLDEKTKSKLQDFQLQVERCEELTQRGMEPPKGLLLYGPPGTGKTTIARVLATEANVSFFALDASEVKSMWLGETEKNIARVFDEARRHRPSIIFIDEIESLVRSRGAGSAWDDDQTSQFLREIDGATSVPGVFVVGATNMPDDLDPALTRGGRMSRQIRIPLPDESGRTQLFRIHSRKLTIAEDVDWARLGSLSGRVSGADIKEIVNAAGLLAFAEEEDVAMKHFLEAMRTYRADRRTRKEKTFVDVEEQAARPFGFTPSGNQADAVAEDDPKGR